MAAVRNFLFLFLLFLPLSFSLSENEALLKLKSSFLISDNSLLSWNSDSIPCLARWIGVICNRGIITGLHLTNLGLSGTIDVQALLELRGLRTISLVNNNFSGTIPDFHKLGVLKSLLLSGNNFSGDIPDDYFSSLTSLKKVWLSGNKFSGKIPGSIAELSHLIELHLESNEFTGRIPDLKQTSITSLDFSNNKLQGEIPEILSKYNASSFAGNEGLCGKPLTKSCNENDEVEEASPDSTTGSHNPSPSSPPLPPGESSANIPKFVWSVCLVIAVFAVMFIVLGMKKRRDDDFDMLGRENMDQDVVEVHVPNSESKSATNKDQSSRRGGESKRGSSQHGAGKGGMSDLVIVNEEKGGFGLADLMKAAAEVLGNGGLGSAYKAVMANGVSVVVKRMRDMNKIGKDGFDAEMRRFGRLKHQNILTPLAYHYRREEKLLVSEYIPKGSLLYVLHGDRGACHAELNWATRLKIVQGIARGLGFLHSEYATYDLPHGNLKSSNVLLNNNYEPLLSDYAFHPLINANNAAQAMFAYKSPEYGQYQEVSPKSDVFCLGIIILEILTSKFPSQYLTNGKGGTDVVQWVWSAVSDRREAELIDPEIATDDDSIDQMVNLLRIGANCTENNPQHRPEMREAIRRIEEI